MIGSGPASEVVTIITANVPSPPNNFLRFDQLTTESTVGFKWEAPVDDGGFPVIDYKIEMRDAQESTYKESAEVV